MKRGDHPSPSTELFHIKVLIFVFYLQWTKLSQKTLVSHMARC